MGFETIGSGTNNGIYFQREERKKWFTDDRFAGGNQYVFFVYHQENPDWEYEVVDRLALKNYTCQDLYFIQKAIDKRNWEQMIKRTSN